MKAVTILIICVLAFSATAAPSSQLKTTLTNLVNMQTRAVDAVQSALDLLNSLKQQNVDAQTKSDEIMANQEIVIGAQIADLTYIADSTKATGDEATTHRKKIEEEIQVTQEYLVWITNRRNEINRKREEFKEQRCYASLMFVKALKEHDEALEVIRWLREDILGVIADQSEETNFSEIKSSAEKLNAYAHLFTTNQMKEFASLTVKQIEDGHAAQAVDSETHEWDTDATDNTQGNLEMDRMTAGTDERNLSQKILDMVDQLEAHLEESMKNLKQNEIKASWDLVRWLQSTELELVHLDDEQAAKTTYIDKLLIAIIGAKAREEKSWEIYFESATTLNDAIDAFNAIKAFYAQEQVRRQEENMILDEVIVMFLQRVDTINKGMRSKVDDVSEDGTFDDSDIYRNVDSIHAQDAGSLASNVAQESRA